ncbi:MAG: hypothetical protein QXD13_01955 [Candidatus Pacearchaeota archaeon]
MKEESIFKHLKRIRKINNLIKIKLNKDESYLKNREPTDNLWKRIMQEFEERGGEISDNEMLEALRYFGSDFKMAEKSAARYFTIALKEKPSSKIYNWCLQKALDLAIRAERDINYAHKICPEPENPYRKERLEEIKAFKERLFFAREFPKYHRELSEFHFAKKRAARNGDYKYAAILRDDIRNIVAKLPTYGFNDNGFGFGKQVSK